MTIGVINLVTLGRLGTFRRLLPVSLLSIRSILCEWDCNCFSYSSSTSVISVHAFFSAGLKDDIKGCLDLDRCVWVRLSRLGFAASSPSLLGLVSFEAAACQMPVNCSFLTPNRFASVSRATWGIKDEYFSWQINLLEVMYFYPLSRVWWPFTGMARSTTSSSRSNEGVTNCWPLIISSRWSGVLLRSLDRWETWGNRELAYRSLSNLLLDDTTDFINI